jgi:hypothetical protein
MKRYLLIPVLLLMAAVLGALIACGTVAPTPNKFDERLAYGYGTVTALRNTATTMVTAKQLSAADAQNVQTQADSARTALDMARAVYPSDPAAANTKLVVTLQVLQALQTYLTQRSQP